MQLEFRKDKLPCMQPVVQDDQVQEQTQEIRISDGMPDIGSILCTWGQVILRGKEWDGDSITVNGGTMVWVQYLPDGGEIPETVECWLPFQLRWNLPEAKQEGMLLTQLLLKSVDARSTSARKMIVRTNIAAKIGAMERCLKEIFVPEEKPEDVQLHTQSYPVLLTTEAGEKAFSLEETFPLGLQSAKICAYWLQPEITEHRIMGDKVVFRGNGALQVLIQTPDGSLHSRNFELPFSQYSELDAECSEEVEVVFCPVVTSLEAEITESDLRVKAGITGQYEIRSRPVIRVVTDAYSPCRDLALQQDILELPGILESKNQTVRARLHTPSDGIQVAAAQFLPGVPTVAVNDSGAQITLQGHFQTLQYDLDGVPKSSSGKWEQQLQVPMDESGRMEAQLMPLGTVQTNILSGQLQQQSDLRLQTDTRMDTGISVVTGLELGELRQPDPGRPSIILRRAGSHTLWELAKTSGSTVEDIMQANHLHEEPEEEQMLLIPVK